MGAKAVVLLPCPGYSTEDFITTHRFFTGIFGRPKIIYTDHAPSLIKAAETPDWGAIGDQIGGQGTEWRLTAKGCSWRNGLAERVIRAARHSLAQELRVGETLDFHQFGAILAVVTAILNSRPLSLRVSPEGEFHSLAPRDVLFGRAGRTLKATSRALEFTLDAEQDIVLQNMSDHQVEDCDGVARQVDGDGIPGHGRKAKVAVCVPQSQRGRYRPHKISQKSRRGRLEVGSR